MMNKLLYGILLWLTISIGQAMALTDSVGIIKVKGNDYIIHKVEKGQGLYAVARRYVVPVNSIKSANGDTLVSLQLDQVIFVPLTKTVKEKQELIHKVEKGETLYKISKQYNVSVDDIIKWNHLSGVGIKEGDKLVIIKYKSKRVLAREMPADMKESEHKTSEIANEHLAKNQEKNSNEVVEEGIATWVNDPSFQSKRSLALHKSASAGTIIRVVNLINNQAAYVKVVGNLPEGSKEIIKLSKFTAKQLGLKDKLSRVKIYYFKTTGSE